MADFLLRVFTQTNVKPVVVELTNETIIFEPGKNFEQTVNNSSAVFVLLTTTLANNRFLRAQIESVCGFAAAKDVWIFEPVEQFGNVAATVENFKHYARYETTDEWALYLREAIKFYDDTDLGWLAAAGAGGGALLAEKDKIAGSLVGALLSFGLAAISRANRVEFGQLTRCRKCSRSFQLHLTQGTKEYRCAGCGLFRFEKNSSAYKLFDQRNQLQGRQISFTGKQPTDLFMSEQIKIPKAFISYSWDSDEHKDWVCELATRLRGEGVDVTLDQWHLALGDPLPEFMERAVRENDFVLLVCTPNFKARADDRKGGVGYEGNIITGEMFHKSNHRKFIPILRHPVWAEAAPDWLRAKTYIDLTGNRFEENFEELVHTLHGETPVAPPLGKRRVQSSKTPSASEKPNAAQPPQRKQPSGKVVAANEAIAQEWKPIKITGIISEEITKPKMDGTRGSGLYAVPFRLSARPPKEWAQLFVQTWNSPPRFTSMHRPGICKVSADKVILDGTTIEEVEKYHRETLIAVLERVNQAYGEYRARVDREAERKRELESQHDGNVSDFLKRIKFD